MAAKIRPTSSVFALLLALLTLTGTALPMPALWQCRHAAQWVAAVPPKPSAMPCRPDGQPLSMAAMPCCALRSPSSHAAQTGRQLIAAAPCRPTFLAATPSAARLGAGAPPLRHPALSDCPTPLPFTPGLWQAPRLVADRPRPPPGDSPPPPECFRSPTLRAPPVA